jgi:hypothetical protein
LVLLQQYAAAIQNPGSGLPDDILELEEDLMCLLPPLGSVFDPACAFHHHNRNQELGGKVGRAACCGASGSTQGEELGWPSSWAWHQSAWLRMRQVLVAAEQAAAVPLSTAAPQEVAPAGLVDLAEDMVSEQYAWLTNLVNFFAQFQGLDAACQARSPPCSALACARRAARAVRGCAAKDWATG